MSSAVLTTPAAETSKKMKVMTVKAMTVGINSLRLLILGSEKRISTYMAQRPPYKEQSNYLDLTHSINYPNLT